MFLKIKDATDVFQNLAKENQESFSKYYVQEDVWDFHVFRVLKGDYDNNQDVYTVEMENIDKLDVAENLGIELGEMDVREAFKYVDNFETIKAVIRCDVEKGFENWDYKVVDTMDEAIELVDDGLSNGIEVVLFEDTEPQEEVKKDGLIFHSSLRHAKGLLDKLLADERFKSFEHLVVATYQNCREQGYSITYQDINAETDKVISFSTTRGGDDLIIYHGSPRDISISEDAYQNGRTFRHRHYNAATNYIYDLLKKSVKQSPEGKGFINHKGLEAASDLVDCLLKDERERLFSVMIEGFQTKNINGYAIQVYDTTFHLQSIGVAVNEQEELTLYFGRAPFSGIQNVTEVISYKQENKQAAIEKIFETIEKANQAKV